MIFLIISSSKSYIFCRHVRETSLREKYHYGGNNNTNGIFVIYSKLFFNIYPFFKEFIIVD